MEKILVTVHDAATALSLSPAKVFQLIAEGQLQSMKIGKSRRIRVEEINRFIDSLTPADGEDDE
jgi:excisionase family DNA binding protein